MVTDNGHCQAIAGLERIREIFGGMFINIVCRDRSVLGREHSSTAARLRPEPPPVPATTFPAKRMRYLPRITERA
jgi:hypothetical protein